MGMLQLGCQTFTTSMSDFRYFCCTTVVFMRLENINGRLIPTAEVTSLREQTTKARITEIYLFFKKTNFFARYFGLQYKPSSGAERKRKVRNIKGSLQRRLKI